MIFSRLHARTGHRRPAAHIWCFRTALTLGPAVLLACAPQRGSLQRPCPERQVIRIETELHPVPGELDESLARDRAQPPRRTSEPAVLLSAGDYLLPPTEVISLLEREKPPTVAFHAGSRLLTRSYHRPLVPREEMERPRLNLAGIRFDPLSRIRWDHPLFTRVLVSSLDDPKNVHELRPPDGALFGRPLFSPDGNRIALPLSYSDHLGVAVYDFRTQSLKEAPLRPLNGLFGAPCSWVDQQRLACAVALSPEPPPASPAGPIINEIQAGAAPARTHSGLLRQQADDARFVHYGGTQIWTWDAVTGAESDSGVRGLLRDFSVSPNGDFVWVEELRPPFSRILPAHRFRFDLVVHEAGTGRIVLRSQAPAQESSTTVTAGPRWAAWHPTEPASLAFVERAGDRSRAPERLLWFRPLQMSEPKLIQDELWHVTHMAFTNSGRITLTDAQPGRRFNAYLGKSDLRLIATGSSPAIDGDPALALRLHGDVGPVLERDETLYFARESHDDVRNFQELVSFRNGQEQQLWKGSPGEYAPILGALVDRELEVLIVPETPHVPPRVVVSRGGRRQAVTDPHPGYPELRGVTRRLVRIPRPDGVTLSAILYLPRHFSEKKGAPTVIWIYPRDYRDPEEATRPHDQYERYFDVSGASRFSLLTQGFALLDIPAVPIVDDENAAQTEFIPQLVASVEAAHDALVKMGVADPAQISLSGRSFGAFGVATVLAHSERFAAGIALSGAYNRTLTPFGFQYETRSFWQSQDTYIQLSPFFFADRIHQPLLLIHGADDDNAGTPAFQSERFYAALVGNGARVRYVEMPFEGHRFVGREAVLHATAEMINWLESASPRPE